MEALSSTSSPKLEKRFSRRLKFTGLLPGIFETDEGKRINLKTVDISEQGLGIITEDHIVEGQKITLKYKNEDIHFTVGWQKLDFGKHNLNRCGLILENPNIDLHQLFKDSGCIK